jgi:hypothetical protein
MDTEVKLVLGGVYKTIRSDSLIRILAFDNIEIFYDVYYCSLNEWAFASKLKRQGTYYRQAHNIFLQNATFIKEQTLTEDEFKVFRPDLPFRLCRNKEIAWTNTRFSTLADYKHYALDYGVDISNKIVLPIPAITIEPFGAEGRITSIKSTLVTSIDVDGFTAIELLWLANNIQAEHAKHIVDKGVGIYRSGHEKKVPSYYIWGYYDMGNSIPKEE